MVESDDGETLVPFDLDHIMAQIPELGKLHLQLESYSLPKPIDSSDMRPEHWCTLTEIIASNYADMDGFLILHGSDTLAYTASALSFALAGLRKPVILTGSQLPIGMIRTDARENFITAVELAGMHINNEPIIQEVAIYFEYKLYRGNRTMKVSAEAFEAFESPNYPVLAEAGVHIDLNKKNLWRSPFDLFTAKPKFDSNIGVLTMFPGIQKAQVDAILNVHGQKGLILQTFGSGNATREPWFIESIESAIERGLIVLNLSQCDKGAVEQGKYQTSAALKRIGVIGGADLTLEAGITKLMFLLAHELDPDILKEELTSNLRGELTGS